MANPVNNNLRPGVGITATPQSKTAQTNSQDKTKVGAQTTADASIESGRLQQLRERIDTTPDVDQKRIEDIKQALAEGRLQLNPELIAQKFASLEGLLND